MATNAGSSSGGDSQFSEDLKNAAGGDSNARRRLWEAHYDMLRDCASAWVERNWQRRGSDAAISLGGTAIVHEAYMRLHDRIAAMAKGRTYFFGVFYTECMRIVIDHYRKTKNDKGRGNHKRVELQSEMVEGGRTPVDIEKLFSLLQELERQDSRVGQVAMLKVLESRPVEGKPEQTRGLTNVEVAELLDVGLRTVEKDWAFAKAYLLRKLQ